ncbi:MAG: zinc ribbon domain-containing protein [Pyrinomonadaceae bacterium]|nr:zinc ribbon domain-containing protein [Pyrinomonadaceae bacterium]
MFCPRCGSSQSEQLKFCKSCGANLSAVRQVVDNREPVQNFDWSNTWVAEMFRSSDEIKRRKDELERQRGITPEIKRYKEIKAGVITAGVGLAVGIFLFVFMQGIILAGKVSPDNAEIISRLWIAGVIPVFVGIALMLNGMFVSKKMVEAARRTAELGPVPGQPDMSPDSLPSAEGTKFIPSSFSVTEEPTKHLRSSGQKE